MDKILMIGFADQFAIVCNYAVKEFIVYKEK